jgi:DNA-binding LacI/PurR family transcriptional regulator
MSSTTPPRRSTMKDVARHAGVSVSTVSYVINDSGPVAPDRRARVLAAVQELGYAPNEPARSLKRRRVATIGLIVPDLGNQFFAAVAEGVTEAAMEHDVLVVLCTTDATQEREAYHTRLLRGQRLDGVIYLSGTGVPPRALQELAELHAVVFVDERLVGLDVPFVGADNRRGARDAMAHVLANGHTRIAVIGGPPALWTSEQRLAGYREALAAAGHDPDETPVLRGDYRQESGYVAAREALTAPEGSRPTAFACANDLMAFGVIAYCRDHGLRVPGDVSVVGFDDVPLASLLVPSLTTVRQPAADMGRRATEMLLAHVAGKESVAAEDLWATELQVRESVGPAVQ